MKQLTKANEETNKRPMKKLTKVRRTGAFKFRITMQKQYIRHYYNYPLDITAWVPIPKQFSFVYFPS